MSCREYKMRKFSWVSSVSEENEAAEGQTLSLCVGSAPWASSNSTTAKWPPAQASDNTVWSLFAVVLLTFAPAKTERETSAKTDFNRFTSIKYNRINYSAIYTGKIPSCQMSYSVQGRDKKNSWESAQERENGNSLFVLKHQTSYSQKSGKQQALVVQLPETVLQSCTRGHGDSSDPFYWCYY